MSESTERAAYDQRDRDEELLSPRAPETASCASTGDQSLQELLDRATGGGLRPRWLNQPELNKPDDRCVVYHGSARCYRDATWRAWIGCIHEHVADSGVCGFHMIEIETFKGGWQCQLCWDATGDVVLAKYIRKERMTPGEDQDQQRQQLYPRQRAE